MGKFDGKLLVSDMDATLLDREHRISKANREAIEYFISEGGCFTVASGRMVPAIDIHIAKMEDIRKAIQSGTGIRLEGW